MTAMFRFLLILTPVLRGLGTCALVGVIAGALGGSLLSIPAWFAPVHLVPRESLLITAFLTVFTWIAVMFVLCVLVRLVFSSVALPSLVNCFLTCLLTVFAAEALGAYRFAWLLGMLIGATVGSALCRLTANGSDKRP